METINIILLAIALNSAPSYDLDKVAKAIAISETGDCKAGVGVSLNNCHGLKYAAWLGCEKGHLNYCKFSSPEESYIAFKKVWVRGYNRLPDLAIAKRYSSEEAGPYWLEKFYKYYNNN